MSPDLTQISLVPTRAYVCAVLCNFITRITELAHHYHDLHTDSPRFWEPAPSQAGWVG